MTPRQAEKISEWIDFCLKDETRSSDPDHVVNAIIANKVRTDANIKIIRALSKYRKSNRAKHKRSFFGGDSLYGAENDN